MKNLLFIFLVSIFFFGCVSKKEYKVLNEKHLILTNEFKKLNTELKKERQIAVEATNKALKSMEICKQKNISLINRIRELELELKSKNDSLILLSK